MAMNRPGDQFLAGAALPLNQDVCVMPRHIGDNMKNVDHLPGFAQNIVKAHEMILPLLQLLDLRLQRLRLQGEKGMHNGIVIGRRRVLDEDIQDIDLIGAETALSFRQQQGADKLVPDLERNGDLHGKIREQWLDSFSLPSFGNYGSFLLDRFSDKTGAHRLIAFLLAFHHHPFAVVDQATILFYIPHITHGPIGIGDFQGADEDYFENAIVQRVTLVHL